MVHCILLSRNYFVFLSAANICTGIYRKKRELSPINKYSPCHRAVKGKSRLPSFRCLYLPREINFLLLHSGCMVEGESFTDQI